MPNLSRAEWEIRERKKFLSRDIQAEAERHAKAEEVYAEKMRKYFAELKKKRDKFDKTIHTDMKCHGSVDCIDICERCGKIEKLWEIKDKEKLIFLDKMCYNITRNKIKELREKQKSKTF